MNANVMELETIMDDMANQGDREITKSMFVLISALKVGPVLDRLVSETGYPQQFVGPIVSRMQHRFPLMLSRGSSSSASWGLARDSGLVIGRPATSAWVRDFKVRFTPFGPPNSPRISR